MPSHANTKKSMVDTYRMSFTVRKFHDGMAPPVAGNSMINLSREHSHNDVTMILHTKLNVCILVYLLDDAEQVDVGVVDGEVNEDGSGSTIEPQVVFQLFNDLKRRGATSGQILRKAASPVSRDETPVTATSQFILGSVDPSATHKHASKQLSSY